MVHSSVSGLFIYTKTFIALVVLFCYYANMNVIAPVILSKYDPNWVAVFNKEKEIISKAFGEDDLLIEHIGSTAIAGSVAKPEIDILIGLEKLEDAMAYIEPLKKIDYVYYQRFEEFVPERRYFRKSEGITPLFHIHMVEATSDFYKDHIIFRDYLNNHPEIVKEYNQLKQNLIVKFNNDRKSYSKGKEEFIFKILKMIKTER